MKIIRNITLILILVGFNSSTLLARKGKSGEITLPRIPTTVKDYLSLRNELGKSPQAAAALFVAAMIIYADNKDLGSKCFTISFTRNNLSKSSASRAYKGYEPSRSQQYFIKQLNPRLYLGRVYIQGTSHKNAYKLKAGPYKLKYVQFTKYKQSGENGARLYLATTSGNRERPISFRQNNRGVWKVHGASSLFVGVGRRPAQVTDDDL